jgi:hypothetical protein
MPQKLFYKPGTIEELEEDESRKSPKFRIGGDSPLLVRDSNAGISSLARISTCNSSFTHVPTILKQDSSK